MNNQVISAGIDVSKDKLDLALILADRNTVSRVFKNNVEGINKLVDCLKKHRTAKTVPCVIESTGDYHLLAAFIITHEKFLVNCINPIITKKYQKSSIRDAKTDPIDAKRLAQIGLLEDNLPVFSETKESVLAKKSASLIACLEKNKQRLSASIKQLEETSGVLGLPEIDMSSLKKAIEAIDSAIAAMKKVVVNCASSEDTANLSKLDGLSEEKAAMVIALIGNKNFSDRDQLVSFVGLDIRLRRSGYWKGMEKLTKRGNPYARKVLFQIAWGLKTHNDYFKELYQRAYIKNGKSYRESMLIVARKFLRIFYSYHWQGKPLPVNA